jgi:hypothetical protein
MEIAYRLVVLDHQVLTVNKVAEAGAGSPSSLSCSRCVFTLEEVRNVHI